MSSPSGPAPRTATTRHVPAINRTAILDLLRTSGPLSRRDLRDRTGLGSATIERLCSAMLSEGVLETAGVDRSSTGRPSILLRYVSDLRAVVVIDVTDNAARGRLVDLGGNVLYERQENTVFSGPPSSSRLEGLLRLIDHLVDGDSGVTAPLDLIGVTLPGIVDDGVVRLSTELDWHDLPLARILVDRVGIPVHVENDANATAYAELVEGVAVGAQSAVSLVLGAGIGAGIVSDGRLYRGHGSASGEVGYLLTSPRSFDRYFTGEGDMEARVREAVLPFAPQGSAHVDRRIGPGFRAMMSLAEQGDLAAQSARNEFFDNLALTCAAIAVVLAPSVIVLAGAFAQYGEAAEVELSKRIVGRIPSASRIAIGTLGFDAAITGMAALTIERARHATYLA